MASLGMAQTTISGQIIDDFGDPLPGAAVMFTGTSNGTVTDLDGNFALSGDVTNGIKISYVGYETMNYSAADIADGNLGVITLEEGSTLDEIVVTGTMDIVRDRRTPVAVSTIGLAEIQSKGGNVEFPELLKNTPSIYVDGQAGGYGESQIWTRGFDQTNTAFLLNGQPINGMEDGKMYWSNWSGMMDVASAVQVQRGLGSSKLAISSVGGTTNIVMKSTEDRKGGSVGYTLGNDGFNKFTGSYSTGLINNKFAVTALVSHWQGNGWADGTSGAGQSYFLSAGFQPSKDHNFNLLLTGAPQYHDQNFNKRLSDHVDENGEVDAKFNNNWGLLNGEEYSIRRNYYHKPVANLNWDWTLNEKSKLSTVAYASWGRGGGSGPIGSSANRSYTAEGQLDFDAIVQANIDSAGRSEYVVRNSVNNHQWFGLVSRFETSLTDNLEFSAGADLRTYRGSHFRQLRDLLGAPAYTQRANARFDEREVTNTFEAAPWAALSNFADTEDQIAYSNDERISYAGVFSQIEYTADALTLFAQGALSNQSHIRFERFNETEANEDSETVSNVGYNIKGGASYAIDDNNIVFFNTGLYSRQPFHDNVYLNFSNTVNPVTENEQIFGLEAGYKLNINDFSANVNVYRTSWANRTNTSTISDGEEVNGFTFPLGGFANITDLDQLHTGAELDFRYKANQFFSVRGFGSVGNWVYDGNANQVLFDDERNIVDESEANNIDGVHVGGSAQTTAGLGLLVRPVSGLRINLDMVHNDRLFGLPRSVNSETDELQLPGFTLFDMGAGYTFSLPKGQSLRLNANIYNMFGTEYIARATSAVAASTVDAENYNGVNLDNFVQFGTQQTWNVNARFYFN